MTIPENRNPKYSVAVRAGGVVVLILAALAAYCVYGHRAAAVLPSPVMPSPNAYDSFRAATLAMVFKPPKNAFMKAIPGPDHAGASQDPRVVAVLALRRRNETAIATLEQGFQFQYRNPPFRTVTDDWSRPLRRFRQLGEILSLSSWAEFAHGDTHEALRMGMDAVEMGQMIVNGGSVAHLAKGAEIQSEARDALWDQVDHLNEEDCAYASKRLETIQKKEAAFTDVLTETKWTTLAVTNYVIAQSNNHRAFETTLNEEFESNEGRILLDQAEATFVGGRILDQVAAQCDAEIAASRLPYGAQPVKVPLDPLPQLICDGSETEFRLIYTRNQCENRLLQTAIALRRYRLAHHTYPRTLHELTPNLLPAIPQDPFAAQAALRYRRTADGYVLYSIGPDITDNYGTQIFNSSAQGKDRYTIGEDSPGDIVVHNAVYLRSEPYVQPGRM